jgi:4a-hydroxytetrahydrobiopterin dehydratase
MSWKEKDGSLHKHFEFADFKEAFAFLQKVAELAEEQQHHPRIENEYNKVDLYLRTHDADAVTDKDHMLAEAIDAL